VGRSFRLTVPRNKANKAKNFGFMAVYLGGSMKRFKFQMRYVGHVASIRDMRNAYKSLVGNPEGKRQLGTPRSR
jgi:hypothetical protein